MTSRMCASAPTCLAQPHLANPRRAILHFGFRGRSPGDIWAKSRPFPAPYGVISSGILPTLMAYAAQPLRRTALVTSPAFIQDF